jgi:hypothetical protein
MTVLRGRFVLAIAFVSIATACTQASGEISATPTPTATRSSASPHATSSPSHEPASQPVGPPEIMSSTAVSFVDPEHGFIGGKGGIWSTSDGAHTWRRIWEGPQRVVTLDAVDADHLWASVARRDGRDAELLRTIDSGAHWNVLEKGTLYGELALTSTTSGWAIAAPAPATTVDEPFLVQEGPVVRTVDDGDTWRAAGTTAQSICSVDENTAWVASGGIVRRTLDAGATWTTERLYERGWWDAATIRCADESTAWDLVWSGGAMSQQPYIASRTLDGVTWTPLLHEAEFPPPPGVHGFRGEIDAYSGPFAVTGAANAVFAGSSPAEGRVSVTRTSNSGITFTHTQIGEIRDERITEPLGMSFTAWADGWLLVGQPGTDETRLWHTSDGGSSWVKLPLQAG